MDKKTVIKSCCVYVGLLLLNAAPIIFSPILYLGGGPLQLALFPMVILLLIHVNYHYTQTLPSLFFLDLIRTVSLVAASLYSAELYCKYIRDDLETIAVGQLLAFVWGTLSGLALIIAVIIRCVSILRRRKNQAVSG